MPHDVGPGWGVGCQAWPVDVGCGAWPEFRRPRCPTTHINVPGGKPNDPTTGWPNDPTTGWPNDPTTGWQA